MTFSSSPEKRHRVGPVIGRLKSHVMHTFYRPRGRANNVLTSAGGRLMERTSGPDFATNGLRQLHLTRLLRCGSRLPHHVEIRCDQLAEDLSGMAEFGTFLPFPNRQKSDRLRRKPTDASWIAVDPGALSITTPSSGGSAVFIRCLNVCRPKKCLLMAISLRCVPDQNCTCKGISRSKSRNSYMN